ncbi:MarR family transcriptional regulator [Clostridium estertheticum]|uniref:MarR family winged helix-turn-helix transcriptional regulator n=1 Tax=Clostridium estertheticum TaxID=238834 RepID=UPI001CF1D4E8|nr:MarR family transcriptional regulator [Clostridium estertheticum]MCB2308902.1 MarR family transcriptional regulator [Clostridium estertheticum]MCB2347339.1 MarR family transcriptional regulator [Clostridium estertheticum]MCB2351965.1 MarR family transcriptional regulator [Clostridium estertheticum]WAG46328.1 MarR family transcriptional regulator [Clostridium estertheticum]
MQNLSYLIIKASRHLKNKLDKALKEFDITAAQFSVIIQIHSSDHPITAAEIAQNLGSDRPTISGVIHRLEKKGIVFKIDNPDDKRSSYLEIYKESNKLIDKIKVISDELTINIFSIYSKEETKLFTEMIFKLIEGTEE